MGGKGCFHKTPCLKSWTITLNLLCVNLNDNNGAECCLQNNKGPFGLENIASLLFPQCIPVISLSKCVKRKLAIICYDRYVMYVYKYSFKGPWLNWGLFGNSNQCGPSSGSFTGTLWDSCTWYSKLHRWHLHQGLNEVSRTFVGSDPSRLRGSPPLQGSPESSCVHTCLF